jgi:hypothetical protein
MGTRIRTETVRVLPLPLPGLTSEALYWAIPMPVATPYEGEAAPNAMRAPLCLRKTACFAHPALAVRTLYVEVRRFVALLS